MPRLKYIMPDIFLVLFFVFLLNGCDTDGNKQKVGYIDMKVVLAGSGLVRQEEIYLEQVKSLLKNTDKQAKELYGKLDATKLSIYREADQMLLCEQLQLARQSARNVIIKEAIQAAKKISENKGLQFKNYGSLVLTSEEYVDITEEVIEELKGTTANFGALPMLFIKLPGNKEESQSLTTGLIGII